MTQTWASSSFEAGVCPEPEECLNKKSVKKKRTQFNLFARDASAQFESQTERGWENRSLSLVSQTRILCDFLLRFSAEGFMQGTFIRDKRRSSIDRTRHYIPSFPAATLLLLLLLLFARDTGRTWKRRMDGTEEDEVRHQASQSIDSSLFLFISFFLTFIPYRKRKMEWKGSLHPIILVVADYFYHLEPDLLLPLTSFLPLSPETATYFLVTPLFKSSYYNIQNQQ